MIQDAGFECVYASGAGIVNNYLGYADMGIQTMHDILNVVREIVRAVNIPVISDIDTGFGNVLNVARTIREFESVGVAGVHIEDQGFPKRCGHFDGKDLIPVTEMVNKIRVAIDTRKDQNFLVIARTDAREVEGLQGAIDRANKYGEAGADLVFIDAPESVEELKKLPEVVPYPHLVDMTEGG